jgi:hypothetical protein
MPAQAGLQGPSTRFGAFWHAYGALLLDPALMRMTSRFFCRYLSPENLCKVCAVVAQTLHKQVLR